MKHELFRTFASCCLFFISCMPIPVQKPPEGGPSIRVGLLEHMDNVRVSIDGAFKITDTVGNRLAVNMSGGEWDVQVKRGRASRKMYRLLVYSTPSFEIAESKRAELEQNRHPVDVVTIGRKITETTNTPTQRRQTWFDSENEYKSPGKEITDNRVYRLYLQRSFARQSEAEAFQRQIQHSLDATVQEFYYGDPSGTIVLRNLGGGTDYSFGETIKIVGSMVTIREFSPQGAEPWEMGESRRYRGDMEFRIDNTGKLTVINDVPVELYLRGVVPAEMPIGFPLEALKAQAVAARSNVIQKIGIRHHEQNFDVCDEEHCQVYRGVIRESATTDRAVSDTQGRVLVCGNKICNATFFSTCGGHTENSENVWEGDPSPYLRGRLDSWMRRDLLNGKLKGEEFVWQWLNSGRDVLVFCNTLRDDTPQALQAYSKYFRWDIRYLQAELAEIVRKKSGQNIGKIKDIIPQERGVSGRLKRIKIVGTQGEIIVDKELKIREILGEPRLYSSCFAIQRYQIIDGVPAEFLIKGAGFGHGVGMCQVGAAGMALAGKKYDDILKHYFTDIQIKMIY